MSADHPPFKFTSNGIPAVTMTITEEEQEALFAAMNPILDGGAHFPRREGLKSFRERLGMARHAAAQPARMPFGCGCPGVNTFGRHMPGCEHDKPLPLPPYQKPWHR